MRKERNVSEGQQESPVSERVQAAVKATICLNEEFEKLASRLSPVLKEEPVVQCEKEEALPGYPSSLENRIADLERRITDLVHKSGEIYSALRL